MRDSSEYINIMFSQTQEIPESTLTLCFHKQMIRPSTLILCFHKQMRDS